MTPGAPSLLGALFCYNKSTRNNAVNLFVTSDHPLEAAYSLPDKLIVKMPLENAQMLAANFSDEFLGYGGLSKKDGGHYKVTHKNHPCTKWGRECKANTAWMILHGLGLCAEYRRRYGKVHSCLQAHLDAKRLFEQNGGDLSMWRDNTPFARAINGDSYPEIRFNEEISTPEAYRQYLHHKSYAKYKVAERTPAWWDQTLFESIHQ
jgi:hypothetical protein